MLPICHCSAGFSLAYSRASDRVGGRRYAFPWQWRVSISIRCGVRCPANRASTAASILSHTSDPAMPAFTTAHRAMISRSFAIVLEPMAHEWLIIDDKSASNDLTVPADEPLPGRASHSDVPRETKPSPHPLPPPPSALKMHERGQMDKPACGLQAMRW
jgi:hypothetical protein